MFVAKNSRSKNILWNSVAHTLLLATDVVSLPPDILLKSSKTTTSHHCEKGRSPDKAIQKLAILLDCHVLYRGLAMTPQENVGW